MERPFNRERFLLWFLAASMAAQYAFLMVGTVLCFRNSRYRLDRKLPPLTAEQNVGCIRIGDRLSTVFELTTATTLALLGGSALAAAAADARTAQRRDL